MSAVPALRVEACGDAEVDPRGAYVLYWMIAARRATHNFALDRAVAWCQQLGKPLVVLEALRSGYRWANQRLHRFVIEGMLDNEAQFEGTNIVYYPYVEPQQGQGRGLLEALAKDACVVVTDEFPSFFLPRMVQAAARQVRVRLEQVDSNGMLPLRATTRVFPSAHVFRRFLHHNLPSHLAERPRPRPLASLPAFRATVRASVLQRWPRADLGAFASEPAWLDRIDVSREVHASPLRGGARAAERRLRAFVATALTAYEDRRNEPGLLGTSQLSPYLHFGHLSSHQIFEAVSKSEDWTEARLGRPSGSRAGFWGMSAPAEAYLDQVITWRELGYNMCHKRDDYDQFDSLPPWAQTTLAEHERDPRPHLYGREELERAGTHDALWNAAQMQLVRDGWQHNYMRMLWGKKILEWSRSPREALTAMIELMNKYSLDGRNPNSYTGYMWTLGRYDRPWGPERPIFGKVRYMSSDNTRRKLDVRAYLERYA